MKKKNGQLAKMSCDVTEFNIISMFHELADRSKYTLPEPKTEVKSEEKKPGPKLTEITEEDEEEENEKENNSSNADEEKPIDGAPASQDDKPLDKEYVAIKVDNIKIHFLPLNCIPDLGKKSKYQNLFNMVFLSNSMVHHLTPENFKPILADQADVILETALFMLDLLKEQVEDFAKKINSMAESIGCQVSVPCNPQKDFFARFNFKR